MERDQLYTDNYQIKERGNEQKKSKKTKKKAKSSSDKSSNSSLDSNIEIGGPTRKTYNTLAKWVNAVATQKEEGWFEFNTTANIHTTNNKNLLVNMEVVKIYITRHNWARTKLKTTNDIYLQQ